MAEVIELTYRGTKYECQFPEEVIETDENIGEIIKLIYRDREYEYKLTKQASIDSSIGETIKLIYHDREYEYVLKNPTISRRSQAINWRFRAPQSVR
jgi:hypothetical protein